MNIGQPHEQAALVLKLMGHPLRLRILFTLLEQPYLSVSALQEQLEAGQSLLSHNLINMKDNGLLVSIREGTTVRYTLARPELIRQVSEVFIKATQPD